MKRRIPILLAAGWLVFSLAAAGTQPEKKPQARAPLPMDQLANSMAARLGNDLQVKTIVGQPMKVGRVTLIPIMMIDIGFGGGGGGAPQAPDMGGKGFYMSGEARPIGFVVVGKSGTQFLSVGKIPKN